MANRLRREEVTNESAIGTKPSRSKLHFSSITGKWASCALEVFIVAMISLLLASAIGLMVPILLIGRA
jgi:hypothetical protein